jgi:hypothetical protein
VLAFPTNRRSTLIAIAHVQPAAFKLPERKEPQYALEEKLKLLGGTNPGSQFRSHVANQPHIEIGYPAVAKSAAPLVSFDEVSDQSCTADRTVLGRRRLLSCRMRYGDDRKVVAS